MNFDVDFKSIVVGHNSYLENRNSYIRTSPEFEVLLIDRSTPPRPTFVGHPSKGGELPQLRLKIDKTLYETPKNSRSLPPQG